MDLSNLPLLGKLKRTLNILIVNFILLAVLSLILGLVIPFYPQVLDFLVAALLIVASIIFLNISFTLYDYKKKHFK